MLKKALVYLIESSLIQNIFFYPNYPIPNSIDYFHLDTSAHRNASIKRVFQLGGVRPVDGHGRRDGTPFDERGGRRAARWISDDRED